MGYLLVELCISRVFEGVMEASQLMVLSSY
jgi:hypothetical protein